MSEPTASDMGEPTVRSVRPVRTRPRPYWVRLLRCVVGLIICGLGIAFILAGHIGLAPWDVLHQGVSDKIGWEVGSVIIVVGVLILVLWIPMRQRPGVGTILNALILGITVDIVGPHLPEPNAIVPRLLLLALGIVSFGIGSGLYIGSGLGPGPRDGLMTGLARITGWSVRIVRTGIEIIVLAIGWLLGGSIGVGTVAFALLIGPIVQWSLSVFGHDTRPKPVAATVSAPTSVA